MPLERAGLRAAAGCSLMDPSYTTGTAAWAGKQWLRFTVSIQACNTQKSISCVSTLVYHSYQIDPKVEDLT